MKIPAKFPNEIWDGTSESRSDETIDRPPDIEDWNQIVAEVIAIEVSLSTPTQILQSPITIRQSVGQDQNSPVFEIKESNNIGNIFSIMPNGFIKNQSDSIVLISSSGNSSLVIIATEDNFQNPYAQMDLTGETCFQMISTGFGKVCRMGSGNTQLVLQGKNGSLGNIGIQLNSDHCGFFGVDPQPRPTYIADATDLASAIALINDLKARLIEIGIGQ